MARNLAPIKNYLEILKWMALPLHLYSPGLAPSEYWLFRQIQNDLGVTGSDLLWKSKNSSMIGLRIEMLYSKIAGETGKLVASIKQYSCTNTNNKPD